MSYPGAVAHAPNGANVDLSTILPCRVILRNSMAAIFTRVSDRGVTDDKQSQLMEDLRRSMFQLLNHEIVEGGDSYPFETALSYEQFVSYYLSHDCFALYVEEQKDTDNSDNTVAIADSNRRYNFGKRLIGSVHIRPNFPGRAAHVANGAFLVVPQHRRIGAAKFLGAMFPTLAKMLGYRATLFNLVFEANEASLKLWRKLRYPEVGRLENAGRLKAKNSGEGEVVSAAVMFAIELDDAHVWSPPAPQSATDADKTTTAPTTTVHMEELDAWIAAKEKEGGELQQQQQLRFGEFLASK